MRLVFAGTPRTAVPSLEELLRSKHEVVAVLTRPDAAAGRGRAVGPSPVAEYAASAGIEALKPVSPRDPGFQDRLRALAPDCCPVTAYGVVAKGFNMYGEPVTLEGTGQLARCVQHETDHLDGVLFIDRLDPVQRKLAMKEIRESDWWGAAAPKVKISPHPTGGKAL